MRRLEILQVARQNIQLAARRLLRERLASAIALLCIALGVGATTTVFSVANALLLRPLPFPNGDRLVAVRSDRRSGGTPAGVSSFEDFVDWRDRQRTFAAMGAVQTQSFTLVIGGEASRTAGAAVSRGLFDALGVHAARGRLFVDAEDEPGAPGVAVVSRGFAERALGGAGRAIGTRIDVGGTPHTVVGVLEERDRFPGAADVWVPLRRAPVAQQRGSRSLLVYGALRPGVGLDAAQRDLAAITARLAAEYPQQDAALAARVVPLRDTYVGAAWPALRLMVAAAVLVFAAACANVATLQLARATAREQEMAVRAALGGAARRLVGQLLTESVLLGVMGGALGVWCAVSGSALLAKSVVSDLPPWMTFGVDGRVLAFTLAVSTAAGVAFGLAPAVRLSGSEMLRSLRAGTRSGAALDLTRGRLYRWLVAVEVALSLVLLSGASLTVESFRRLERVDPGFDAGGGDHVPRLAAGRALRLGASARGPRPAAARSPAGAPRRDGSRGDDAYPGGRLLLTVRHRNRGAAQSAGAGADGHGQPRHARLRARHRHAARARPRLRRARRRRLAARRAPERELRVALLAGPRR